MQSAFTRIVDSPYSYLTGDVELHGGSWRAWWVCVVMPSG